MYKVPEKFQRNELCKGVPNDGSSPTVIIPEDADLSEYMSKNGIEFMEWLWVWTDARPDEHPITRRVEYYALPTVDETAPTQSGRKFHVDPVKLSPHTLGIDGIFVHKGMYVGCDATTMYSFPLIFVLKGWRAPGHEFGFDGDITYSLVVASNWTIYELYGEPLTLKDLYQQHHACESEMKIRSQRM